MFSKSHDFTIAGGVFHNAVGDLNISNVSIEDKQKGLLLLHRHTSTSAPYDAEARFPPPLCHPRTREGVLKDLHRWIQSSKRQDKVNSAGSTDRLERESLQSLRHPSRNNPRQLFTTVALQMVMAIPELRDTMDEAVVNNPLILTSSLENQFNILILQPWLNALRGQTPKSLTRTRILIIDGLDECADSQSQQRILLILASAMQAHTLPFHILVCSRPEPRIKEAFQDHNFNNICRWMSLDSTYEASQEIRVFLEDGFKRIFKRHSSSMEHVPRPWPTVVQIECLVQKASGQFIYPSTVLKYVDEDGVVPADRLNIILGIPTEYYSETDSPFSELDALYHQILSTVKHRSMLLQVLAAVIVFRDPAEAAPNPSHPRFNQFTALLESIPQGTIQATFSGVYSLFKDPSPVESGFEFCHASFPDFLFDRDRSLHFSIDKATGHDYLAQCCLGIMAKMKADTLYSLGSVYDYADRHWAYHCIRGSGSDKLRAKLDQLDAGSLIARQMRIYYGWTKHGVNSLLAVDLCTVLMQILRVKAQLQVHERFKLRLQARGTLTCFPY
ncbi:hypothetical protein GYMLUDRAFT_249569 [Collybiopsis luxurians FD-317 M1]|uniref:Nephrocystin 3-like N-terminal domain-containing protein n=1 Tax=Collybiopsis luxurians FD-317 M1 TaxID=944289 RepID=A0A0D0AV70_9AGAR|nr:hypothetical protein GYMLUDRAFT_249569 [Collybiopsis luxurians FD-317 M1]